MGVQHCSIGFDTQLAHGTGNTGNPSMGKQFAMSD
ncbi:hypothetical protein L917_07186 [Phytophthora nicotianae]|uniref:Uncharacterized protein n=2 Tax=Phytophthora nicotianae TaxID=4792 RepID=V9FDG2_PHYNI|nr:hypothetical protein F443_07530 [Phytophthora nicotianae P1569]ETL94932.1 hypothetical protein L917_07186 [Phytophthora nicotianae]